MTERQQETWAGVLLLPSWSGCCWVRTASAAADGILGPLLAAWLTCEMSLVHQKAGNARRVLRTTWCSLAVCVVHSWI